MTDSNELILLVDDEEINLFLLQKRLGKDFKIVTALSGIEALEVLQKHQSNIKAVISDMMMPGMDGIEFITQAKEKYPTIHCFILTGYYNNDKLASALKTRLIEGLFEKPFDYEVIKNTISMAIKDQIPG